MATHSDGRARRIWTIVAALVIALGVVVALGLHIAADVLKARVVAVLGPLGSAERIDVGFKQIRLTNVVIRAPQGWPATDALRAASLVLEPDFRELLSRRVRINHIEVNDGYLSIQHTADGKLSLLPNFRSTIGTPASAAASAASGTATANRDIDIGGITFHRTQLDYYDAAVATPPFLVHIDDVESTIGRVHFPLFAERTDFQLNGVVAGPHARGTLQLSGWTFLHTRNSSIHMQMNGVDVVALQPYLARGVKTNFGSGTLNLDLNATIRDYQMHAPGVLTLNNLQIAPATEGTFLSIPKTAVIDALKDRKGRITVRFELDGNLHDPKFSLEGNLAERLGGGLAKALGVSAEGVATGVGETAKGLGGVLKSLIGQ